MTTIWYSIVIESSLFEKTKLVIYGRNRSQSFIQVILQSSDSIILVAIFFRELNKENSYIEGFWKNDVHFGAGRRTKKQNCAKEDWYELHSAGLQTALSCLTTDIS